MASPSRGRLRPAYAGVLGAVASLAVLSSPVLDGLVGASTGSVPPAPARLSAQPLGAPASPAPLGTGGYAFLAETRPDGR
jgi:hypothetical protein